MFITLIVEYDLLHPEKEESKYGISFIDMVIHKVVLDT